MRMLPKLGRQNSTLPTMSLARESSELDVVPIPREREVGSGLAIGRRAWMSHISSTERWCAHRMLHLSALVPGQGSRASQLHVHVAIHLGLRGILHISKPADAGLLQLPGGLDEGA